MRALNETKTAFTGNLIPNEWYELIKTKRGKPDVVAISILSEIFYRWRINGGEWQTSYDHFSNKFGFCHDYTRRILVRLEKLRIIEREHRTITLKNGLKCPNALFIRLSNTFLDRYSMYKKGQSKRDEGKFYPETSEKIKKSNDERVCDSSLRGIRLFTERCATIDGDIYDNLHTGIRQIAGDMYDYLRTPPYAAISYSVKPSGQFSYNIDINIDNNKIINKEYRLYRYGKTEFFPDKSEELGHGREEPTDTQHQMAASELSESKFFEFESLSESELEPELNPLTTTPTSAEPTANPNEPDYSTFPKAPTEFQPLSGVIEKVLNSVTAVEDTSNPDDAARAGTFPPTPVIPNTTTEPLTKKTISEFELTKEDVDQLRSMSGREFSTNFINELKIKLAAKYPQNSFASKERFLNYMAKALKNEKHDAIATSHESFRLKCNVEKGEEGKQIGLAKERTKEIEDYINKQPEQWQKILRIMFEKFNYNASRGWFSSVTFIAYDEDENVLRLATDENTASLIIQYEKSIFLPSLKLAYPQTKQVKLGNRIILTADLP